MVPTTRKVEQLFGAETSKVANNEFEFCNQL